MNRDDCVREKVSNRVIGLFILPVGLILAFASFFFLPVVGLIFAVPILVFSGALIMAPESKVCRLLTGRAS